MYQKMTFPLYIFQRYFEVLLTVYPFSHPFYQLRFDQKLYRGKQKHLLEFNLTASSKRSEINAMNIIKCQRLFLVVFYIYNLSYRSHTCLIWNLGLSSYFICVLYLPKRNKNKATNSLKLGYECLLCHYRKTS